MIAFFVLGSSRKTSVGQLATHVPQPIHPLIASMVIFYLVCMVFIVHLRHTVQVSLKSDSMPFADVIAIYVYVLPVQLPVVR